MPPWMVFKVAGTMLFNKIDLDDNPDDEPEDLGEFIAAQFLQLYGLQKIATKQLKLFTCGLRDHSHRHLRLQIFRTVAGLVP